MNMDETVAEIRETIVVARVGSKPRKRGPPAAVWKGNAADNPRRRKIDVACEDCRERKRKCDGVRPRCGACSKRGPQQQCVYAQYAWRACQPTRSSERSNEHTVELAGPSRDEVLLSHRPPRGERPLSTSDPAFPELDGPLHHRQSSCPSPRLTGISSLFYDDLPQPRRNTVHVESALQRSDEGTINPTSSSTDLAGQETLAYGTPPLTDSAKSYGKTGVDAMGAVSDSEPNGVLDSDSRRSGSAFFGPSSIVNCMSRVYWEIQNSKFIPPMDARRSGFDERTDPQPYGPRLDRIPLRVSRTDILFRRDYEIADYSIPPRSEADLLVNSYFSHGHILHPFLHKATFLQQYEKLFQAEDPSTGIRDSLDSEEFFKNVIAKRQFYVTVNLVFALGCRLNPSFSVRERVVKSERFYLRTTDPRKFEALDYGCLELVQSLLLTGQYLQTTEKSSKCWNVIGVAVRVAQGIGLHLDVGKDESYSQLDIEMRRRVWGSCVTFDRELSMTYGRPLMVHPSINRGSRLPSIIDDDLLQPQPGLHAKQPEGIPSLMAFFVHILKLNEILAEIISTFYCEARGPQRSLSKGGKHSPDRVTGSDCQSLLSLDALLTQWRTDLPPHLKSSGDEDNIDTCGDAIRDVLFEHDPGLKSKFDYQALALHAHYLHIKILLLRPSLLMLLNKEHTSGNQNCLQNNLQHRILIQMSDICVSTAQREVDYLTGQLSKGRLIHAWWYEVYYVYTCAIVILIGRLCQSIDGCGGKTSLAMSWEKSLRFFESYFEFSQPAQKGYKALEIIDRRLFSSQNSDPTYFQEALRNERMSADMPSQLGSQNFQENAETPLLLNMTTADSRNIQSSTGSRQGEPRSTRLGNATEFNNVLLNDVQADETNAGNTAPNPDFNMNWSRDDLQLDWLNSMPFIQENGGNTFGLEMNDILW